MIRITLRQCEYFRAVAQSGGIASASRNLGVSQPAVAQAITKLEAITGLVLFRRLHARGMDLTGQGEEFLRYANDLLSCAGKVTKAVTEIADHRRGTIRLGCFQSIAPFCLARIVRGYRERAPGIALEVSEKLQDELTDAIEGNELDLAIMYDLGLDPGRMSWQELSAAPPYLIVPPGHRLAERNRVSIREIASEDYILFDAPQSREYFFAIFERHGIRPRIGLRSTSIESVRCSVGNGLGVSILAMRPASDETYDGQRVVSLELEEILPPTRIVIAYPKDRTPGELLLPFVRFCQDVFTDL
ncbi:LysR family transcriptional regulator [Pelagibius sp. Alg239-R121]|uniref:LysR family transcriptional regulator n=1 Tax=Pelagibius sp. Alg239-R121 TaxID=2993448 RepID=UPI0024A6DEB9|nr:LysR family transcriptional regulator [Pelagibius sp. Alg239-R121]